MLGSLGITRIDHLAVTTADLNATLEMYLSMPGARLDRGPGDNVPQGVRFAFVKMPEFGQIEILSPLHNESPIAMHVSKKPGPYHLCYAVRNMELAIEAAAGFGAKLLSRPAADVAFDGRRVAFLYHPNIGLFELVDDVVAKV
jgi:catechol 2,3-dioxygenase-like lactoylglutathione lyase family enzyme